jgi:hypothetical protein
VRTAVRSVADRKMEAYAAVAPKPTHTVGGFRAVRARSVMPGENEASNGHEGKIHRVDPKFAS